MLQLTRNFSLSAGLLCLVALAACSKPKGQMLTLRDCIPVAQQHVFDMNFQAYVSLRPKSNLVLFLKDAEKRRTTSWEVADTEWEMVKVLMPVHDHPGFESPRTVREGKIAVPRLKDGDVLFEMIPLGEGKRPYTIAPLFDLMEVQ